MRIPDLVLVHAPSTYRNPNSLRLHGMLTASVPSTAAAELYPLGFLSIAGYIERHGYRVAIRNLALATSLYPRVPSSFLRKYLRARVVGIDVQWATNIDGALEVARLVKESQPEVPVVVGGITASYFHRELMARKEIDFVVRGDCAEVPLLELLNALTDHGALSRIPNLCWRDGRGKIFVNDLTYVPETLDEFPMDYSLIIRSAARTLDPLGALLSVPYRDWIKNPAAALITQKGCPHDCVLCGGSATAYSAICGRRAQAVKSPRALMRDVASIAKIARAPVYFVGDLRDPGEDYASEIFRLYGLAGFPNPLVIESLTPAPRKFFDEAVASAPGGVSYMFTADTHDDALRASSGRMFTTLQFEETIRNALEAGCSLVTVFFGIGLPGQDAKSVMRTVDYCGELLRRFKGIKADAGGDFRRNRLYPFISAYLPYIEPGSRACNSPSACGYRNLAPTFDELARIMLEPTWTKTLSYDSAAMDREAITRTTYEALIALGRIHEYHGLLTPRHRAAEERRLRREYDSVRSGGPPRGIWLQGESSLYLPGLRGKLGNILQYRAGGILRECLKGLGEGLCFAAESRGKSVKVYA